MSRRREPAIAADEAVRAARERAGGPVDSVLVLATTAWGDVRPLVAAATRAAGGAAVVGCTSSGVLCADGDVEEGPGVVAAALTDATPFSTQSAGSPAAGPGIALLLLGAAGEDPEATAGAIAERLPTTVPIIGGIATSRAEGPLPVRFLDGALQPAGAVGLVVAAAEPLVGVATSCRLVGEARTVTATHGNVIETLDGRPAFEAFASVAEPLLDDLPRAAQSVFLALPTPDGASLIRGLVALDADRGLLAASSPIPPGTPIRFAVRDAFHARDDLRHTATAVAARLAGRRPALALYVACAGRGRDFYGIEGHDAAYLGSVLGELPLVGLYTGAQIGPAGGRPRLNVFTGVLAVVPE